MAVWRLGELEGNFRKCSWGGQSVQAERRTSGINSLNRWRQAQAKGSAHNSRILNKPTTFYDSHLLLLNHTVLRGPEDIIATKMVSSTSIEIFTSLSLNLMSIAHLRFEAHHQFRDLYLHQDSNANQPSSLTQKKPPLSRPRRSRSLEMPQARDK